MSNHIPTPESENTTGFIRAIAWTAWNAAANAFRAYPNNKHTFTDHWANSSESYRSYHSGYYHMEKCANALSGIPDPEKWVEDMKAENERLREMVNTYLDAFINVTGALADGTEDDVRQAMRKSSVLVAKFMSPEYKKALKGHEQ